MNNLEIVLHEGKANEFIALVRKDGSIDFWLGDNLEYVGNCYYENRFIEINFPRFVWLIILLKSGYAAFEEKLFLPA